tara:strand:+ start:978 stop:1982 length:1005 start_codon:yes stop_codon:yes gene_type:complete
MTLKKILITGGCGFIGSNFIDYLFSNQQVSEVFNIDCLTYAGNLQNLVKYKDDMRYKFIREDLRNVDKVSEIIRDLRPDAIVNFAAESHVDRSITNPNIFTETNIIGTQNLLEACNKYKIKKFVQISTDEVYGDLSLTADPFTENTNINPSSPYSATKASADLLCLAYYRTFGTPVVVTRCSNNYGPYQFPEKLIPLVIERAINNRKVPVYGSGNNVRDWIFVNDHCEGIWAALTKGSEGQVYNFGGDSEISNIDLVKRIFEILEKPFSLIEFVKDRPGHDFRYAINFKKAAKSLNWLPRTDFKNGLMKTIDWYLLNSEWLDNVKSGIYKRYEY